MITSFAPIALGRTENLLTPEGEFNLAFEKLMCNDIYSDVVAQEAHFEYLNYNETIESVKQSNLLREV